MVRRQLKYEWKQRKYHFADLNLAKRTRGAFKKRIMLAASQDSLFDKMPDKISFLPDVLHGSSEPEAQCTPSAQTRFGSDGGTTIPPYNTTKDFTEIPATHVKPQAVNLKNYPHTTLFFLCQECADKHPGEDKTFGAVLPRNCDVCGKTIDENDPYEFRPKSYFNKDSKN